MMLSSESCLYLSVGSSGAEQMGAAGSRTERKKENEKTQVRDPLTAEIRRVRKEEIIVLTFFCGKCDYFCGEWFILVPRHLKANSKA